MVKLILTQPQLDICNKLHFLVGHHSDLVEVDTDRIHYWDFNSRMWRDIPLVEGFTSDMFSDYLDHQWNGKLVSHPHTPFLLDASCFDSKRELETVIEYLQFVVHMTSISGVSLPSAVWDKAIELIENNDWYRCAGITVREGRAVVFEWVWEYGSVVHEVGPEESKYIFS